MSDIFTIMRVPDAHMQNKGYGRLQGSFTDFGAGKVTIQNKNKHILFPPFSTSDLSLGPASIDTEKQRYCVEKRFWKTRGIG